MALLDEIFGIRELLVGGVRATLKTLDLVGATYGQDVAAGTVTVYPGALAFTAPQAADYTAALGEHVMADGSITVSLPPASDGPGRIGVLQFTSGTASIEPAGTDTINGASNYLLVNQWDSIIIQSDGESAWYVVALASGTGP